MESGSLFVILGSWLELSFLESLSFSSESFNPFSPAWAKDLYNALSSSSSASSCTNDPLFASYPNMSLIDKNSLFCLSSLSTTMLVAPVAPTRQLRRSNLNNNALLGNYKGIFDRLTDLLISILLYLYIYEISIDLNNNYQLTVNSELKF